MGQHASGPRGLAQQSVNLYSASLDEPASNGMMAHAATISVLYSSPHVYFSMRQCSVRQPESTQQCAAEIPQPDRSSKSLGTRRDHHNLAQLSSTGAKKKNVATFRISLSLAGEKRREVEPVASAPPLKPKKDKRDSCLAALRRNTSIMSCQVTQLILHGFTSFPTLKKTLVLLASAQLGAPSHILCASVRVVKQAVTRIFFESSTLSTCCPYSATVH